MVTAKKAMTNDTKSELISHCRIAAKANFLLLFPARFAYAHYSSRMIDRFPNWGDHGASLLALAKSLNYIYNTLKSSPGNRLETDAKHFIDAPKDHDKDVT